MLFSFDVTRAGKQTAPAQGLDRSEEAGADRGTTGEGPTDKNLMDFEADSRIPRHHARSWIDIGETRGDEYAD